METVTVKEKTVTELIDWAKERHEYYCCKADDFLQTYNICFEYPSFRLFAKKTRTAGFARYVLMICDYNLAFLLSAREDYEDTIAHEVAHFVVRQLRGESHGDLLFFVLSKVMKVQRGKYHNYKNPGKSLQQAKLVLKVQELKRSLKVDEDKNTDTCNSFDETKYTMKITKL